MIVWWCEMHLSGFHHRSNQCDASRLIGLEGDRPSPCRMVEMQGLQAHIPRVRFGRKLYQEVTYDADLVRVRGEWEPDEPEGWEVFTVMLHGAEAGDFVEAKIEDLRQIVRAYDVHIEATKGA